MRLIEITKKEEFKATLADPNYRDVLAKFENLKRRTAKNQIILSFSYNGFIPEFVIKAVMSRDKEETLANWMVDGFREYDLWSSAVSDVSYDGATATVEYHIYTDTKE